MTLEAIKEAIEQLTHQEQGLLATWLGEHEKEAWDEQLERDFSIGGRGMPLLAEVERLVGSGEIHSADEALDLDSNENTRQ